MQRRPTRSTRTDTLFPYRRRVRSLRSCENRQCGFGPMTTYWFALASRSEFTVLAWLNSAMFGPIDTSYQLLNHSAGTPQPMESSYRPPASHAGSPGRSEEHTSELPSLMRTSYAVFCLKQNKIPKDTLT